jgi:predicted transcriptional regulator
MSLIAKELISDTITSVDPNDKGEKILFMMNIFQVKNLPIVKDNKLINIIEEDDILTNGFDKKTSEYQLSNKKVYVTKNCHIFNIIDKLAKNDLSIIPVVDEEENYMGCIAQQDIFQYFGDIFSFEFPGSIIELTIPVRDYSLQQISHIVESENASIIGLMINDENPKDTYMDVIIKLNKKNISGIISAFERFEYKIKASYSSENYSLDTLKERYDALMHYLNV